MRLESQQELELSRAKLRMLAQRYEEESLEAGADHVRELSMRSLRHLINQMKEQIARFESRPSSDRSRCHVEST